MVNGTGKPPSWNLAPRPSAHLRVARRSYAVNPPSSARESKIANTLTKEWARTNYTGVCVLTGLSFVVGNGDVVRRQGGHPYSPSIDKIDPAKGYTPDNCRFILWVVNKFKDTMSDDEMFVVAGALVARRMAHGLPNS